MGTQGAGSSKSRSSAHEKSRPGCPGRLGESVLGEAYFFFAAALRFFAFFTFGAAGAAAATAFFAFFFAAMFFTSTKLPRTHLVLRPLACQTARDL